MIGVVTDCDFRWGIREIWGEGCRHWALLDGSREELAQKCGLEGWVGEDAIRGPRKLRETEFLDTWECRS